MNTAKRGERAITPEQRRMIFALYRELNIGDDLRHEVQYGVSGKSSLTDFTANDAARLIEHLQRLPRVGTGGKGRRGIDFQTAPGFPLKGESAAVGLGDRSVAPTKAVDRDKGIHRLPSPQQLAVLDHLYKFAGYATLEAQRAFAARIEHHPRPRSMWEAEELIFALIAQCAPKMLAVISAPGFAERLTPFEYAFMYTNTVKHYLDGTVDRGTFNNAHYELTEYVNKRNRRGQRTMPRFSMTKFFEILEKYKC